MRDVLSELEQRLAEPTSRGLATAVSQAIRDGALKPGARLPPIRQMATQLALSPTTVSSAWGLLIRSGTIRTDGRRGTTVADVTGPASLRYSKALERQAPFSLDLSTGVPDAALLPSLRSAVRALTTAGTPGSYLDEPVLPALQQALLRDWPYDAPSLTVVDGAMDALDLLAHTVLRLGDRVICESPSFPPLIDLLEAVGARVVGVPLDEAGLELGALREALATPAAALILQPRAQNPTGVSMTTGRAGAVASLLRGTSTLAVEDDSSGAACSSPPLSLGQWLPDQTVHVRSFSKSHGPDLRLSAMSGPASVMAGIAARRQLGQGWSSRLLQRILLSLIRDPVAVAEVDAARDEYARRRSALVAALATHDIAVGGSDGLNIWVPVHDEAAAVVRLARQGVGVAPGRPFATQRGQAPHVRVTAGLVADGAESLAEQLALAANTAAWNTRAR